MTTTDPCLEWQRTSPVAVVFFLGRIARQVISNGLPAIVGALAIAASGGETQRAWLLLAVVVVTVWGLLGSILSYLRFRFRIIDHRILVHSGVLHREELDIAFSRVQNITIREPFYMRPLGLALLSIDTAGSGKKEVVLGGIAKPLARTLRETILATKRPPETAQIDAPIERERPRLLLQRSGRDIIIYGLTINFLLWVAVAMGAMFGAYDTTKSVFSWLGEQINVQALMTAAQGEHSVIVSVLLGLLLLGVIVLLLPLVGVAGALVRHHGYRLTVTGETYRKRSGLFSRHDESLKRHKIQAVVWKQNFMARMFGRINMQLRLASAGSGIENGQLPTGPKAAFLIPAVHPSEAAALSAEFLPGCQTDRVVWSPAHRRRYILKTLALGWLAPIVGISIAPIVLVSWLFTLAIPVALGFAYLIAHQTWKKLGYAVVGEYGFVRSGFIGCQTTVFPLFKVQRIDFVQTPGQRRHGLANLTIHLASHSLAVPYVRLEDAEKFRDLALYYMESSARPWY